jgi:flagellar biosynthesis/type III secretory pathway protein FliH
MAVSRHSISCTGPFVLAAEAVEPVRQYTAADLAAEFERGRREGARQADTGVDRRFVEFRSEVSAVQNGIFSRLGEAEKMIADQIRVVLPDLAVEVAKRVLAGFTPPHSNLRILYAASKRGRVTLLDDLGFPL